MRQVPVLLMILLCGIGAVRAQDPADVRSVLGRSGYLVVTAARDSSAGFTWQAGSEPGSRSLVWNGGVLTIPDDLEPEPFLETDLGFPVTADFGGTGSSGNLSLADGRYTISEPVMLSDGTVRMYLSRGELEIKGDRLRYRAPNFEKKDPRANLLLLAGIMLLILVLMRRARRILKRDR